MTQPLSAPPRGFADAEFEARLARAQSVMADQGLSGLLLTTEPEVRYFTGFRTAFWQSPTRPWFLFVPVDGGPIAVIPEIGADLMRRAWVAEIRSWPAPAPTDDGITLLVDLLSPLGRSKIGILKGHETHLRMPLGDWERLNAALPDLIWADATDLIRDLRMVKSDAEIEKLAHICAIAGRAFADVPSFVTPGMPLEEVFRAFRQSALSHGADDVPYLVGAAAQGGYADVISPPGPEPVQRGDILMLDTGATWDGYFCDYDRNWAIGQPSDTARRAHDLLWRATEAGLAAAQPGNTCQDLFNAMSTVIFEMDASGGAVGRLGHGLGMQLTEWPSHAAWDTTELRENMVLTLEPSVSYGPGQMMVAEENIVVRAGGARLLSPRVDRDLMVI